MGEEVVAGAMHYHGEKRDGGHPIDTLPSNHSAEHPVVSKPPPGPQMPHGRGRIVIPYTCAMYTALLLVDGHVNMSFSSSYMFRFMSSLVLTT